MEEALEKKANLVGNKGTEHKNNITEKNVEEFAPEIAAALKNVDEWNFNIFHFTNVCNNKPIQTMAPYILNRHGIIDDFHINRATLAALLERIELGYGKHDTIYHTNVHGAEVMRNFHYMLQNSRLQNYLRPIEKFACLMAALIIDFEHTGTTNNFHIVTQSYLALLYNDRMVLENHHVSAFFILLREDECNILATLTRDQYHEFRNLVVELILSTDMSYHFQLLRHLYTQARRKDDHKLEKMKVLSLVLHVCDICGPAKKWNIAHKWAQLNIDEFFKQGDLEQQMGLPISPQCSREKTLLPEVQIHFIEFILEPALRLCGEILDHWLPHNVVETETTGDEDIKTKSLGVRNNKLRKPWEYHLEDNKKRWKQKCTLGYEDNKMLINYVMNH